MLKNQWVRVGTLCAANALLLVSTSAWAASAAGAPSAEPASGQAKAAPAKPSGSSAGSEAAPPPAALAPAAAADIVRLKNGGVVRGSISELDPQGSVTIVTLTGAVRQFPMGDVVYAGPIAKEPSATPAPSTTPAAASPAAPNSPLATKSDAPSDQVRPHVVVRAKESRVHLESVPAGLAFYRLSGIAVAGGQLGIRANAYDRVCVSPCDISLPAGKETLALSEADDDKPIAADPIEIPAGEANITGSIESNQGLRIAGWVGAAAGLVVGGALIFTSFKTEKKCEGTSAYSCHDESSIDSGMMLGGALLATLGTGVGIFMTRIPDSATVHLGKDDSIAAQVPRLPTARAVALHGTF